MQRHRAHAGSSKRTKRSFSVTDDAAVVSFKFSLGTMLTVLAFIAGVWLLLRILSVLLVLVMALMIAGATSPVVTWLEERKVRRVFALCLVYAVGVALAVALATLALPTVVAQARTLADNEPKFRETVAGYLEQSRFTANLAADLRNIRYTELLKSFKSSLLSMGMGLFAIVAYSVSAVFLAFYIMVDRDRLRGALFAVVPRAHHLRVSRIVLNLSAIVGSYIRGQVITCGLLGAFLFVLLLACGVQNALAIAVFGSAMDLLPFVGIFLVVGPAMLAASVKGPVIAGLVFALILAYEEFESRVLVPLVYGRALRLPSSVVFFALLAGAALGGIVGALLALPLAAAALMLVEELRLELPGETVQPKDIEQRREDDRTELEYARRAESMPAEKAAAIAVEISDERKKTTRPA